MIVADEAYNAASERTRKWAENELRRRFTEVYGEREGPALLHSMQQRMAHNIKTDNPH